MILERIIRQITLQRHLVLERSVAPLELQVILNHLREHRRRFNRHVILLLERHVSPAGPV